MPVKAKNAPRVRDEPREPRREPVVARKRKLNIDEITNAIAKEDAKIIARASARALRRGLH